MRNVKILLKHETDEDGGDGDVFYSIYRIVQCGGCDEVYFQREYGNSEDLVPTDDVDGGYEPRAYFQHWPPSKKRRPDWMVQLLSMDAKSYSLLEETYRALDADLRVLAAIGLRTTLDRATEKLGINTELTFSDKLQALVTKGSIGSYEKDVLAVLIDAGSAAAHRGWRPSEEELKTMLDIVEIFLMRTFVLEERARNLKSSVPARPKKASKSPPKSKP